MFEQIHDAARTIQSRWQGRPRFGIILGTGLGGLAEEIQAEAVFAYKDIPHFPVPTVQSHAGRLVCGKLSGKAGFRTLHGQMMRLLVQGARASAQAPQAAGLRASSP